MTLLFFSVIAIVAYGWLLYRYPIAVLQWTAFIAVSIVLSIIGWMGWVMVGTQPQTSETQAFSQTTRAHGEQIVIDPMPLRYAAQISPRGAKLA